MKIWQLMNPNRRRETAEMSQSSSSEWKTGWCGVWRILEWLSRKNRNKCADTETSSRKMSSKLFWSETSCSSNKNNSCFCWSSGSERRQKISNNLGWNNLIFLSEIVRGSHPDPLEPGCAVRTSLQSLIPQWDKNTLNFSSQLSELFCFSSWKKAFLFLSVFQLKHVLLLSSWWMWFWRTMKTSGWK